MKKLLSTLSIAFLLTGCSTAEEDKDEDPSSPSESTSSQTHSSTRESSSSTNSKDSTEHDTPYAQSDVEANAKNAPKGPVSIDQLTLTPAHIAGHGVYLDPADGTYYYCNPTEKMWADVPPGTCNGPHDYTGALNKFKSAVDDWEATALQDIDSAENAE
ncbi:membrane lipoprotein lipid attachment site-containing protein [Corynebacterium pseudodiphtheriticum]|uniref:membrane lipoprotein lipid attachment site-containing protein n=1 Tax=Corynebacterium pseudodiphtheriticum TaxID=37637 RepID=UPI0025505EF3|nr:membrane lipoprotein lipid attachment site-containing protein [Corynebacterium pseudodiphtheriticum]MDK8709573.1 membrane lipoprotein lipid attachment site-containing protein [Corynebacterium pseudodiphtheriticum]